MFFGVVKEKRMDKVRCVGVGGVEGRRRRRGREKVERREKEVEKGTERDDRQKCKLNQIGKQKKSSTKLNLRCGKDKRDRSKVRQG